MKLPKIVYPLLLVFVLLFVQQDGAAHTLSHALAEQSQDQSLPQDTQCDLCAVYAQFGSAISGIGVFFTPNDFSVYLATTYFFSFPSFAFTAFAARAPPRLA